MDTPKAIKKNKNLPTCHAELVSASPAPSAFFLGAPWCLRALVAPKPTLSKLHMTKVLSSGS